MRTILFSFCLFFSVISLSAQQDEFTFPGFDEIRIGQHIETEFIEGAEYKVEVVESEVPTSKINFDLKNDRLVIYLDGAKYISKRKKGRNYFDGTANTIYSGKQATLRITYVSLSAVSVMGAEKTTFLSDIAGSNLNLNLYGEGVFSLKGVELANLDVDLYGEYDLLATGGNISNLKITTYGESTVSLLNVKSEEVQTMSYGEAEISVHVGNSLKVGGIGEYLVSYKGQPNVVRRGLSIGEARVVALD